MTRTVKKILKGLLFIIVAPIIGFIPAWCCIWCGSFILLLFGTTVSATAGDVIVLILAFAIGGYTLADMLGL